jgi:alanine-glyoxylate transaminase/serine-glyoxylate transaminase/serine-pyruvate transaminase
LGALAGNVWRIGLMGQSATPAHVMACLTGLETVLAEMQAPIETGKAAGAASAVLFG